MTFTSSVDAGVLDFLLYSLYVTICDLKSQYVVITPLFVR